MKRNVVLFFALAAGALYLFFGSQEESATFEEVKIESITDAPDEPETKIYHTRKLLFIETNSNEIPSLSRSTIEDTKSTKPKKNKLTRKRKRGRQNSDQQYAWNFNLNVTRHENNGTSNNIAYPVPNDENRIKSDGRFFGMAMSVAGNGPDQSVGDLYQAWDSVGQFLRTLFGGSFKDLKKNKEHGVSLEVSPLPNGTFEFSHDLSMEGSGDVDPQDLRYRKAKFLLEMFGFGGNKENPPREEGSGDIMETEEINSTIEPFGIKKQVTSTMKTQRIETSSDFVTTSTEKLNVNESITSNTVIDETSLKLIGLGVSTYSNELLSEVNCTDCENQTELFVSTDKVINEQIPTSRALVLRTTELPLVDEKIFCIALLRRMHTTGRSVESEGSGNIEIDGNLVGTNVNTLPSNILTDKPITQNVGFFESIWNRIIGRRAASSKEPTKENRGARFIKFGNLFGGFGGSGRSADSDEGIDISFDELHADLNQIEDEEQFLMDCEEFLKSAQTDTRPNIFDLVDPIGGFTTELTASNGDNLLDERKIELTTIVTSNFDSTTQNEIFTTTPRSFKDSTEVPPLSYFLDNQLTTESLPNHQYEIDAIKPLTDIITEQVFTEAPKHQTDSPDTGDLLRKSTTERQEHKTTELPITNTAVTKVQSTHNLNDGYISSFGSGGDEGPTDISNINERVFGGLINFGSGEREMKEIDSSTISDQELTTEKQKGRSFGLLFNFGSGERAIDETSADGNIEQKFGTISPFNDLGSGSRELVDLSNSVFDENEDTPTSTMTNEGRIFGWILGFGSGERDISQHEKLTTNDNAFSFIPTTKAPHAASGSSLTTAEFLVEISEQMISSQTNLLDESDANISTETNDSRLFELNIFGSGDGRELPEVSVQNENVNCLDCISEQSMVNCDLCRTVNSTDYSQLQTSTTQNYAENQVVHTNEASVDYEVTHLTTVREISTKASVRDKMSHDDVVFDDKNIMEATNILQPLSTSKFEDTTNSQITKTNPETAAEQNKSRLFNTIFLTGSGDGGLFVDDKGPINLIQESEFTSPVIPQLVQPRRGGRRHDPPQPQVPRQITTSTKAPRFQSTTESELVNQTDIEETTLDTFATDDFNETDNSLEVTSEIEDETSTLSTTFVPENKEDTSPSTRVATTTKAQSRTLPSVTVSSTSPSIKPRTKITEPPPRVCTSASQCNKALNERCIHEGSIQICNCGRSYVRSPETGKCESPVVLTTSLKLPGEVFHRDLKDKNSERFRKMANDSVETMWLLLGDDPDLFRLVSGVSVSGFGEGSLVVHWALTLAAPSNESVAGLIGQVDAGIKEAVQRGKDLPLDLHDAVVVAVVNDINPCEKEDLNYCSKHALCIQDLERGFRCSCKDDFMDQSADMDHPGEKCIATCAPYYCGDYGECSYNKNGDRQCSCNSWYFGEKCEISGIVVIAAFASFNAVLMIAVLVLVCYCRKRRYRQSRFYGQNQVRFQSESELGRFAPSPRVADAIALSDVGPTKTSKYMSISTPVHKMPEIKLTSPSIMGSSIDDYDSTFDRTPSVEETSVEIHRPGSTPKI